MRRALLAIAIAAGACTSAEREGAGPPSAAAVEAARRKADAAAASLTADLFTELARVTAADPSAASVTACGDIAQRLTAETAARTGVAVRRTTLRLRNPANAPDDFERRVLEVWTRPGAQPAPRAEVVPVAGGGHELRYLRPIILQPLCTNCHGAPEAIRDDVRAALRERYPADAATGFRPGDVRGAVSVRVPLGAP
jgi:hypothetical protein